MIEHVTYTTSTGRTFDLMDPDGAVIDSSDVLGWEFDVSDGSGVTLGDATWEASVRFADEGGYNAFLRLTAADAASGACGELSIDGWTLACSVVKGELADIGHGHRTLTVSFYVPEQVWRHAVTYEFLPASGDAAGESLDYPHDYQFDFDSPNMASGVRTISTDGGCSVGIVFYGPCSSPYCRITTEDGTTNVYGVDADAADGERITVDPLNRRTVGWSVYRTGALGEHTNLYSKRRRGASGGGSYIFERMPGGTLSVSWPQSYGVAVTVVEERTAVPWT